MTSISSIMTTALSGLTTYQAAIAVTGENLANADAAGYCRRTVQIKEIALSSGSGAGSQVADAQRVTDRFCAKRLIESQQELGRFETARKYISSIETVFDESEGEGLGERLDDFWNAWSELANNASGDAERSELATRAGLLAEELNRMAGNLDEIEKGIDLEVAADVEEINKLTKQIAELNGKIADAETRGQNANALLDSLDVLTGELAGLIDFKTYWNDSGQVCLQLDDGKPLVDGAATWSLGTERDSATGRLDVTWNDGSSAAYTVTDLIEGGSLGGCLEIRDDYLPAYRENLDEIAAALIDEVNALLLAGYDSTGQPGVAMFQGSNAGDVSLNPALDDDPGLIAAASTASSAPGDGATASAVAALRDAALMNGGTSTLGDFYSGLVTKVGADTAGIESSYEQQSNLTAFYQNYKESISGVSQDEEAARLVLYQQGYDACARVIEILREIMETTVNL